MNVIRFIDDYIIKDKLSKMLISEMCVKQVAFRINWCPRKYLSVSRRLATADVKRYGDCLCNLCLLFTSSPRSKELQQPQGEETVTVGARKEVHLPVLIEEAGITLRWNISSDRDINFRLYYSPDEVICCRISGI